MTLRSFQNGDETIQAAIYNEAAGTLAHFKPATAQEVKRRTQARDFDPGSRFYAEEGGQVVGYCLYNSNGRVNYPWCRPGYEHWQEPLFQRVLESMSQQGLKQAWAAYRHDWPTVGDFFLAHGFVKARDMVNFIQDIIDLPTIPARPSNPVAAFKREDVPAVFQLCPEALRVRTPAELEEHLFRNPYFGPEALYVLRGRSGGEPLAIGLLITEPTYADPSALDANMPCFRLGAFGTEGVQTKRVRGLFSFLARADQQLPSLALDLLSQTSLRVQHYDDIETLAAQVPSDVPHLLKFYTRYFRQQGSFPVYEKQL